MIQFNLLPDIKLQYIKSQRTKRTVILLSATISGAAVALLVLLFLVVNVVQKQHLSNLNDDIADSKKTLQAKPELSKILTIQNQLNSLPALHQQKPVTSRVYGFIQQVTPAKATISTLTVNFAEQTIKIEGSTDTLVSINTFVDTLKFTTFTAEDAAGTSAAAPAFSEVVLSDFGVTSSQLIKDPAKAATYIITLKYDPAIFSGDKDVKLTVASKVTTRSETEKPSAIFESSTTNGAGQ